MAPLALACGLVPWDRATAVANASDFGASPGSFSRVTAGGRTASKGIGVEKLPVEQEWADGSERPALSVPSSEHAYHRNHHHHLRARRRHTDCEKEASLEGRDDAGKGLLTAAGQGTSAAGDTWVQGSVPPEEPYGEGSSAGGRLGGASAGGYRLLEARGTRRGDVDAGALLALEGGRAEGDIVRETKPSADLQKGSAAEGGGDWLIGSPSRGFTRGTDRADGELEGPLGDRPEPPEYFESSLNCNLAFSDPPAVSFEGASNPAGPSVVVRDVLSVVDRCVFCLVVLGAAATAAVTAGMSTFGTGFVISLELLSSETAAAATFGGVICAAGIMGTPAGGALIDAADPEGRLGDEKKLAVVLTQATALMCGATGACVRRLGRCCRAGRGGSNVPVHLFDGCAKL